MSRPAGPFRELVLDAARQGPCTMREVAHRTQIGMERTRRTVENLARGGELQVVGEQRVDYRNRPVAVYQAVAPQVATPPEPPQEQMSAAEIQLFMQGWPA